jgi:outer membrane protein OmpA-like peptidoglycan-associated protein
LAFALSIAAQGGGSRVAFATTFRDHALVPKWEITPWFHQMGGLVFTHLSTESSPTPMKPKKPIHQHSLALLGIPFLLLTPAADAQDQAKDETVAEIAEAKETAEEKGKARLEKEVAKREEETAKREEQAAKRAENLARRAEEATKREEEITQRAEKAARRAKEAAEKRQPAVEPQQDGDKIPAPRVTPQPPTDMPEGPAKVDPAAPNPPATGTRKRPERLPEQERVGREGGERPAAEDDKATPPIDMPIAPSQPLTPRDENPPRDNSVQPEKDGTTTVTPDQAAERGIVEVPATEPERLAETEVTKVTREVQRELDQRKTKIEGREEAQALFDEILGAESRISRAEIAREERYRPRLERQHPGEQRHPEASPDQRRAATTYFQERLRGREVEGPPPEFFRRSEHRGERGARFEERVVERVEFVRPRYLNEGRRYVHFDSRSAIPAILMAAQAMNHVRFQPTREIAPIFYERQEVSAPNAMPLPPESYRSEDAWVVSYPVDEKSMISSEDILFLQGSTQFSDPYSYEVIGVMAEAMKAMPEEERFVIEGHASSEGSYESNMVLSQQRAEHIVREIVRRGVSPYRLLPVGYGESEARHPENAAEALRGQDRRVVVFRMKPEVVAAR